MQPLLWWVCHAFKVVLGKFLPVLSTYRNFVMVHSERVANAVNAILVADVVVPTANHMRKHYGCHELRPFDRIYGCSDIFSDASDIANLECNALPAQSAMSFLGKTRTSSQQMRCYPPTGSDKKRSSSLVIFSYVSPYILWFRRAIISPCLNEVLLN
ncbi:hypothetical protein Y032_0121g989 [Ancylostoma ceylanicum]|uniref:Uncharacterized protein n=1 Tax=Ancylostoma ceylanicum TaxID=53326 RepID=A0A016TAI7_9BILA|nr:hypothetical protein Y032_0121g989 [Ancylostoma ceylanicum]